MWADAYLDVFVLQFVRASGDVFLEGSFALAAN